MLGISNFCSFFKGVQNLKNNMFFKKVHVIRNFFEFQLIFQLQKKSWIEKMFQFFWSTVPIYRLCTSRSRSVRNWPVQQDAACALTNQISKRVFIIIRKRKDIQTRKGGNRLGQGSARIQLWLCRFPVAVGTGWDAL